MDVKLDPGTEIKTKVDADGNLWITGLPDPKVEPQPEPVVLTVARCRVNGAEVCAFKVNDNPGPNWRYMSDKRTRVANTIGDRNGDRCTWEQLQEAADEGTMRTYSPRPTETQAAAVPKLSTF